MRYRIFLVVIVALLSLWSGLFAQTKEDVMRAVAQAESAMAVDDSVYNYPVPEDGTIDSLLPVFVPFGAGEKLVYSVQYGIISAGEATLEVRNISIVDSIPCYNIVSNARTNDVFSVVFKVRDRFVSLMDTTNLVSVRYEKHLREGSFKRDESVRFDQKAHRAHYADREVPIAPRTQDVLSSMYYVRTLPLKVGQNIALANHTDGKNYPLLVKVLRKERITVEAGSFDCVVVEPFLRGPGIFQQKGRLTVWLTDDQYRVPVLMQSRVMIGAVSAVLKDYRLADKLIDDEQVRTTGSQ